MTAKRTRANGEGSIFPYRNGFAAYVWVDKPDLRRVFSHATTIADSIEFRTLGEEGSGIRSLREVEQVLIERKLGGRQ